MYHVELRTYILPQQTVTNPVTSLQFGSIFLKKYRFSPGDEWVNTGCSHNLEAYRKQICTSLAPAVLHLHNILDSVGRDGAS
jgi:hypothetical protein